MELTTKFFLSNNVSVILSLIFAKFLTKQTAKSHTLQQLCKALKATGSGVKNAMSRRKIYKCKNYGKNEAGNWEHISVPPEHHPHKKHATEKRPKPEVDTIIGVAWPTPSQKEFLVRWAGYKVNSFLLFSF